MPTLVAPLDINACRDTNVLATNAPANAPKPAIFFSGTNPLHSTELLTCFDSVDDLKTAGLKKLQKPNFKVFRCATTEFFEFVPVAMQILIGVRMRS